MTENILVLGRLRYVKLFLINLSCNFIEKPGRMPLRLFLFCKIIVLLPRKELDNEGNEIDPRAELIDKILEYRKFKQAATELSRMEDLRMLLVKRGNVLSELIQVGEDAGEGTEIQAVTLYKLMKAFEKVAQRLHEKNHQSVHTVVQYNYTMEGSREFMLKLVEKERTISFEKIFEHCENRIHAIFLFLNMLELIQLKYLTILLGEGRNNFIVEYNFEREPEEMMEPN